MIETDVIGHLIDVEHQASSLVLDAQVEADQRIAEARAKADVKYKEAYEALIQSLEKQSEQKMKTIKQDHSSYLEEFSERILKSSKDIPAFEEMLTSLLFNTN